VPRLRYLAGANSDLVSVYNYIRQEGGGADSARRFIRLLRDKSVELAGLPRHMGRPRYDLKPGIRSFAFRGNIIMFRYVDDRFEVVSILEGHRDIDRHFDDQS
jgi:toxin ParE1/3/4